MTASNELIMYHDNCNDGITAAALLRLNRCQDMGDDSSVELLPVKYGMDLSEALVKGHTTVFIVDFNFENIDLFNFLCSHNDNVVLIDHHASAVEWHKANDTELSKLTNLVRHLNTEMSGAKLVQSIIYPDVVSTTSSTEFKENITWLTDHVDDRDRWQWKLPDTRKVFYGLTAFIDDMAAIGGTRHSVRVLSSILSLESSFKSFKEILLQIGTEKEKEFHTAMNTWVSKAEIQNILVNGNEYTVSMLELNDKNLTSDVLNWMLTVFKDRPINAAMSWYFDSDINKYIYSIRTTSDLPVSAKQIAEEFGGGGHPNAAGFNTKELIS